MPVHLSATSCPSSEPLFPAEACRRRNVGQLPEEAFHRTNAIVNCGDFASLRGISCRSCTKFALPSDNCPCDECLGKYNLAIAYARTRLMVGSTKERKTALICNGVSRLRRPSHHVRTEKNPAVR